MKKCITIVLCFVMVLMLCGCCLKHEYTPANCTDPAICQKCGKIDESKPALGHTWTEATCTEAKTCSVCGATEGEALGHTWQEATLTEPRTCAVCGETEGEPINTEWINSFKEQLSSNPFSCKANVSLFNVSKIFSVTQNRTDKNAEHRGLFVDYSSTPSNEKAQYFFKHEEDAPATAFIREDKEWEYAGYNYEVMTNMINTFISPNGLEQDAVGFTQEEVEEIQKNPEAMIGEIPDGAFDLSTEVFSEIYKELTDNTKYTKTDDFRFVQNSEIKVNGWIIKDIEVIPGEETTTINGTVMMDHKFFSRLYNIQFTVEFFDIGTADPFEFFQD